MTRINSNLLTDTLQLVQLARESALARGNQEQAKRLTPVVNELRGLANQVSSPQAAYTRNVVKKENDHSGSVKTQVPTAVSVPVNKSNPATASVLNNGDFRALLNASRSQPHNSIGSSVSSMLERNQVILAMAKADMELKEIARQMGMTVDEVKMVVQLNKKSNLGEEVIP